MLLAALIISLVADATPTSADAPGLFNTMIESFQDGNWPLAIGSLALILFLLVGGANAFITKMTEIADATRKKILQWSTAASGMLVAFGLALIGGASWPNALLAGLLTCAAAVGFWQLVVKTILKLVNKPEPPARQ